MDLSSPSYPACNSVFFSSFLSKKLEFRVLSSDCGLYPHQQLVRRYLSPHTPYDRLLLFHATGTGKTFICASVSHDHYEAFGKKTLVLTRGDTGKEGFRSQICEWLLVSGLSSKYPDSSSYIKERYEMSNHLSFCNRINSSDFSLFCSCYHGWLVIIDEAHSLGPVLGSKYASGSYVLLTKFLSSLESSKVLLLTATPMTDSVDRICPLLNLILPESRRILPCDLRRGDVMIKKLTGYVSFHTVKHMAARVVNVGVSVPGVKHPLVLSIMKGVQESTYRSLISSKTKNDVSRSVTHASLFCFDDGSYGSAAVSAKLEKFVVSMLSRPYGTAGSMKPMSCKAYRIKREHTSEFRNISQRSCKYYSIIKSIEQSGCSSTFVFIEEVEGSGLLLFASILMTMGYDYYIGQSYDGMTEKRRFTLCVGDTEFCPNPDQRIAGFNDPRNFQGRYVCVMLGSRVVGESITLMNVRHFHCALPHWNDSTIEQALGRVVRSKSHNALPESDRVVNVYIHAAVLSDYGSSNLVSTSIDVRKMYISQHKDDSIKKIERILEASSLESLVSARVPPARLDVSTFCRYYFPDHFAQFSKILFSHLVPRCPVLVKDLLSVVNFPEQLVYEILSYCVSRNVQVVRGSYLREAFGILTLVDDVSLPRVHYNPFSSVSSYLSLDLDMEPPPDYEAIERVISESSSRSFYDSLHSVIGLRWRDRVRLLEVCLETRSPLSSLFASSVVVVGRSVYHVYEYRVPVKGSYRTSARGIRASGLTKKYEEGWIFVSGVEEESAIEEYCIKMEAIERSMSVYGAYGIYSTVDGKLRVRDMTSDSKHAGSSGDLRKVYRGRNIRTLERETVLRCMGRLLDFIRDKDPDFCSRLSLAAESRFDSDSLSELLEYLLRLMNLIIFV